MKDLGLELPVDQTARMTIIHPIKRKPLVDAGVDPDLATPEQTAWIELYSFDSKVARDHERAVQLDLIEVRKQLRSSGSFDPDQIEENVVNLLAALTKDWRLLSLEGEHHADHPCTKENARSLYRQTGARWLREQVDAFLSNRANFA